MLASGFVHPGLLVGLLLVAVPILIHLLSRRQFRRMDWAATYFLLQAERENRRRTQFEQWLLLALRCLAIALLALLIARPFVQPGLIATLLGESGAAERIVLLDDSASLAHRSGARSDLDDLREAGTRLVRWLAEGASGDSLVLLRTSQPDEPLVRFDSFGRERLGEAERALQQLQPVMMPAEPQKSLEWVARRLQDGGSQQVELYLLSDFQRTDWAAPGADRFAPLTALDAQRVRVSLMAVGSQQRSNLAVTNVTPAREQALAGFPAVYRAEIANRTNSVLENLLLERTLNDEALTPVEVEAIEPGEVREVAFEVTIAEPGPAVLRVAVAPRDGLPADDGFSLVADVKPALQVALVNGEPATRAADDEVHFLRNALAPPGAANSGIQVEVLSPGELGAVPLERFDCVLYCNAVPDPSGLEALRRYVAGGGGLVLVLGDQVGDGADWNRLLGDAGLLPGRLSGRVVRAAEDSSFSLVRTSEDPIVAMLPEAGSPTRSVRVLRYVEVAVEPESETEVLARFSDPAAGAAVLSRTVGAGRVVLFSTPLDLEWNDWPRAVDGSYVVTMLELVYGVAPRDAVAAAYVSGQTLAAQLPPSRYELRGVFRAPDYPAQAEVSGTIEETDGGADAPARLLGPIASQLGLYQLELEDVERGVVTRPLAVNLAARESDLESATPEELTRQLGSLEHSYVLARDALLGDEQASRRELWPALLVALFFTLLAEQTLAWWFGQPGRRSLRDLANQLRSGRQAA